MSTKIVFFAFVCLLWMAFALSPLFLPQYVFVICWVLIALPWIVLISIPLCKYLNTEVLEGEVLKWVVLFVAMPVLSLSYVVWQSGLPQNAEIILPWVFGFGALLTAGVLKLSGVKGSFNANSVLQTLLLFGLFGVYMVASGLFLDKAMAGNSREDIYQASVSEKYIDHGITLSPPWYVALLLDRWIPTNTERGITLTDPRYIVSFVDPWTRSDLAVPVDLDTYRAFERSSVGCIHIHKGFFGLSRLSAGECPRVENAEESRGNTPNSPVQQLVNRQFAQLDQYFTALQQQYEQKTLSEEDFFKALQELRDSNAQHESLYQEWTELYPNSYVAHLLYGVFLSRLGWQTRGSTWYADVPDEDRSKMDNFARHAHGELVTSLRLSNRPYMSYLYLLNIDQYAGSADERRHWSEMGNQLDPQNYYLRRRYMYTLMPRWGGSIEEMHAFLEESRMAAVPAKSLAKLEAIIYEDEAQTKAGKKDWDGTLVAWRRVVQIYRGIQEPPPPDALESIAVVLLELNRKDEAIPAMEELLKVNPQATWAYGRLGIEYTRQGRYDAAWEHLQTGAKLNDAWCEGAVGRTLYFGAPSLRVAADQVAGMQWIRKAAAQGDYSSVEFLRSHGQ